MGELFQLLPGKGQVFPGIGPPPTFWPFRLALELSGRRWVCYLHAHVLQWEYNEPQDPLEIKSSAILDLIGSNLFVLVKSYGYVIPLKAVPCPLPSCFTSFSHKGIAMKNMGKVTPHCAKEEKHIIKHITFIKKF